MPDYRLSRRAEADLAEIADYTIEQFGIEQARRYRDGFEACFNVLAGRPLMGRSANGLASGLRRFEHQSHVVFYVPYDQGVLIVRVLHESMEAARHIGSADPTD